MQKEPLPLTKQCFLLPGKGMVFLVRHSTMAHEKQIAARKKLNAKPGLLDPKEALGKVTKKTRVSAANSSKACWIPARKPLGKLQRRRSV